MIGRTFSHYRILDKLGEGGMGVVYTAEDTLLGRRVAIKSLNVDSAPGVQRFRARLLREARAISALSHPHIATVYDYGETDDGHPFIVMELVNGPSLSALLRDDRMTPARAVEIVQQVAEALAEAHKHGIVHRDIKPSNVVINDRDEVKVLDFGLAKHVTVLPENNPDAQTLLVTQTSEGVILGTPLYLSPEQALGVAVDGRSDLFSLGSLLYECIAGRPAFPGASAVEVFAKVIRDDPPPPSEFNPDVPLELDRITLKLLAKKTEDRYQSANDLLTDLSALRLERRSHATTPRFPSAPLAALPLRVFALLPALLKHPRSLIAAFLVALSLGVGFWLAFPSQLKPSSWSSSEAERRYKEGTDALRDGTYYKASKLLEDAIRLDDSVPLAHARLAETLIELDNTGKAQEEIELAERLAAKHSTTYIERLHIEGIADVIRRNFEGAVQKYQMILLRTPDTDRAEKSQVYVGLGRSFEKQGNLSKALETYLEATKRDPQSAAAFLHLGTLYSLALTSNGTTQTYSEAAKAFSEAERLYETSSNYEGVTEVLCRRATFLNRMGGKSAEARAQLERALGITRTTTRNKHQEVRALLQLSVVACAEGKTEEAKQYAGNAVNSAKANGMENLTTQGLIDLGNAFLFRREYDDAESYLKQALEFAERYKSSLNEARAQLLLGKVLIQRESSLDDGLAYVERALGFYRGAGYGKEFAEALLLQGRAKLLKGDHEAALAAFDQAIELAKRMEDRTQIARSHTEIGFMLAMQELYPSALRHYDKSYYINRSLENPLNTAYSLLSRADLLWRVGRYEEAETALTQASVISDRLDSEYRQLLSVRSYLTAARMEMSKRRFAEAANKSRQAMELAGTKIKYAAVEAKSTFGLALTLTGARRKGISLCEEAAEAAMNASFADGRLIGGAVLALAEAELEGGNLRSASNHALQAQESFARSGYQESEYRARLIAVRAARQMNDYQSAREQLSRADELLVALQRKWGAESFFSYIARPDMQFYRNQLRDLSALPE